AENTTIQQLSFPALYPSADFISHEVLVSIDAHTNNFVFSAGHNGVVDLNGVARFRIDLCLNGLHAEHRIEIAFLLPVASYSYAPVFNQVGIDLGFLVNRNEFPEFLIADDV